LVKDVYDCTKLLQHFRQLQKLEANGLQLGNNVNAYEDSDIRTIAACNRNIKWLRLYDYAPMKDKELLYIMRNYPELDYLELYISSEAQNSWPISTISRPTMGLFVEFILKMKSYDIAIYGVSGESWLLETYYTSCGSIKKNGPDSRFKIEEEKGLLDNMEFETWTHQPDGSAESSLQLSYSNDDLTYAE
jgi:hypothetical protein